MNKALIEGTIITNPEISHEFYGEKFYKFKISVERNSGTIDVLNCSVSEIYLDKIIEGERVRFNGEIRTKNNHEDNRSHLIVYVFVKELIQTTGVDENYVEVNGYLCKKHDIRETPLGRKISDFILASNRGYVKSDYIPCISWGRNATRISYFDVGTKISAKGRFQSREYNKIIGDEAVTMTAYELSISMLSVDEDEN